MFLSVILRVFLFGVIWNVVGWLINLLLINCFRFIVKFCIFFFVLMWIVFGSFLFVFLRISFCMVGLNVMILYVGIWLMFFLIEGSSFWVIIFFMLKEIVEWIVLCIFLGKRLRIWLIVFGVDDVWIVLKIKWFVFVVWMVVIKVFLLCILLMRMMFGFLWIVCFILMLKFLILILILCWLMRYFFFEKMNLIGFLSVRMCFW